MRIPANQVSAKLSELRQARGMTMDDVDKALGVASKFTLMTEYPANDRYGKLWQKAAYKLFAYFGVDVEITAADYDDWLVIYMVTPQQLAKIDEAGLSYENLGRYLETGWYEVQPLTSPPAAGWSSIEKRYA